MTPATGHPTSCCPWCKSDIDSSASSCPGCGAPVGRSTRTTQSGWNELPPIKDMARLRAGNSTCQIEGLYVPVADFNLAEGDSVYFSHHVLLWKDPPVDVRRMSLKGAFSRLMAGLPVIMTEAHGPGHIAFSRDEPGEMIALPLHAGQAIDVREHLFLAATQSVTYDWFATNVWFATRPDKDTEYHYPIGQFMDRFSAGREPGLLLLHASGNVFVRTLEPDQTLLVKAASLIYKDPAVRMALSIEYPQSYGFSAHRLMWLHLTGPGRVAVQSAYENVEDEGRNIVDQSTKPPFRIRRSGR